MTTLTNKNKKKNEKKKIQWNFFSCGICFCLHRGRGPLKSTMDVINAAKKISEAGTKLDKLSRSIADMVNINGPHSITW